MPDDRDRLERRLGARPALLASLDDPDVARLSALYERAAERQHHDLRASMEGVLDHAPRMLRGRLAKVLFPKGGR